MKFILAALCLFSVMARADIIDLGTLSYDTFIPAGINSPGVDAFDLSNLSGAFSLPPDFPATDDLTFQGAILTLTLSNLTQQVFDLGDIGPGFLLDGSGNPIVQVPGDQVFASAELTATLLPLTFALFDSTSFTADSSALDILLLPSSGSSLTVDVDQTTIGVSGTVQSAVPEPANGVLIFVALLSLGLVWRSRRKRVLSTRFRERAR